MIKRIWRRYWWVGVLVIVFSLWYGSGAARLPLGYADSDDLLLAASEGSVAHPPGYRMLVLGVLAFLQWVPAEQVALLGHMSSSVLQALSVGMLALLLTMLLPRRGLKQQVAAVLGASAWGLSQLVWLHGTVLEVFPLAQILVMGFLVSILTARSVETVQRSRWEWLAIMMGTFSVFYHQLVVLMVVGVWGWYLWEREWKNVLTIALGTLGVFGVLLLSYGLNITAPAYGWDPGGGLGAWWRFWSRQVYAPGGSAVETYLFELDVSHSMQSLGQWVQVSADHFTVLGLLLGSLGLVYWWRKELLGCLLGGLWLAYSIGLVALMKFPLPLESLGTEYFWGTALRLRMLFVSELLFGFGLGFGVWWLFSLLERYWQVVAGVMLVGLVGLGLSRYTAMEATGDNAVYELSMTVLADLPEQAVLVVDTDMAFSFLYQHIVLMKREDVAIVPVTTAMRQSWFEQQERRLYEDRFEQLSWQMAEVVVNTLATGRRVFLYHPGEELEQLLGLEGNPLFAWPYGYMIEVTTNPPQAAAAYDYGFSKSLARYQPSGYVWWSRGLKEHMATVHTQMGYYWIRAGLIERGEQQFALARELSEHSQTEAAITQVKDAALMRLKEQESYLGYEVLSPHGYRDQAEMALLAGEREQAAYYASRAVMASGGKSGWWEYFRRVMRESNEILKY